MKQCYIVAVGGGGGGGAAAHAFALVRILWWMQKFNQSRWCTWECFGQSRKRIGLKRRMIYRCSFAGKGITHFSCQENYIIMALYGAPCMCTMEDTTDGPTYWRWCDVRACVYVFVLVQLCSACMNWSVLWYIFHVDIATHKLHIIHRVSVWLHKCYDIYIYRNATHSYAHNDMLGFYHFRYCGRISIQCI